MDQFENNTNIFPEGGAANEDHSSESAPASEAQSFERPEVNQAQNNFVNQQYGQPQAQFYSQQYSQQYSRPQQNYQPQYRQYQNGNAGENQYQQNNSQAQYRPYQQSGGYYSQNVNNYQNYLRQQQTQSEQYAVKVKKEKKPASKGFVVGMTAIALVLAMIFGAFVSAMICNGKTEKVIEKTVVGGDVVIKHETSSGTDITTEKGSYAYAASVAKDAVVEINTEKATYSSIFGNYVTTGAGSGVIISSTDSGSYIITCAHVIEDIKEPSAVKVILSDGTSYTASVTAYDSITDIGIIKIDVSGLKTASVGSSGELAVAQEVIAIGNPLGELGGSVTNGIISALEREVIIEGTSYHLMQTNAEINPGNSGGGLFDMNGRLIGIVNAKSSGESVEGIGFAIPIDNAMTIFEELVKNGYVSGRVKLGIQIADIQTRDDVYTYWQYSKYFTDYGVYVITSENDQLQVGDRIVALDSTPISDYSDLKEALLEYHVGDTVAVQVSRLNSRGRAELVTLDIVLTEKTN